MMLLGETFNLVVCQKSKIRDWIEHFEQYYSKHPWCTNVYDLTNKKQFEQFLKVSDEWQYYTEMTDDLTGETYLQHNTDPCQYIGVINYELAWRRKDLLNLKRFTLMLDESSLIQNPKTKQTKFILKLAPWNVILLSGTPVGGKYENLWSQIHLLGWNISLDLYQKQYVNWTSIDVGGVPIRVVDKSNPYKNVDRLKTKLREHGAVFMKTDEVFDLPEQVFQKIMVDSTNEYKRFMKHSIVEIGGEELVGDTRLTKLLYARQLCGHFNMDKLNAFRDLLNSTNDRLIVFYSFNAELEVLKEICTELGRPVSEINGHTKDPEAYENETDSVTLVQYLAGSKGLNLQKCCRVVYFTLPLSSEDFEQSKKRIHRIGQRHTCFYYLMLCRDSIEEKILKTLEERKDYTNELFKKDY